jgi:hypothetical protein
VCPLRCRLGCVPQASYREMSASRQGQRGGVASAERVAALSAQLRSAALSRAGTERWAGSVVVRHEAATYMLVPPAVQPCATIVYICLYNTTYSIYIYILRRCCACVLGGRERCLATGRSHAPAHVRLPPVAAPPFLNAFRRLTTVRSPPTACSPRGQHAVTEVAMLLLLCTHVAQQAFHFALRLMLISLHPHIRMRCLCVRQV